MEIPSSSPSYTPLNAKIRKVSNDQLPSHQLFFEPESEDDINHSTHGEDVPSVRSVQSVQSVQSVEQQEQQEQQEQGESQGNGEVTLYTDSDCDTIYESDTDQPVGKSNKYLSALLTDSVLEQLPLPPTSMENLKKLQTPQKDLQHSTQHDFTSIPESPPISTD